MPLGSTYVSVTIGGPHNRVHETDIRTGKTQIVEDRGSEIRHQVQALVDCDRCGEEVELVADTEAWEPAPIKLRRRGIEQRHAEYGPAQGVCCGLLYVDSWDGCSVYDLEAKPDEGPAGLEDDEGEDFEETDERWPGDARDGTEGSNRCAP